MALTNEDCLTVYAPIIDDAWRMLVGHLLEKNITGSRDGECREQIGVHVILDGAIEQFLLSPRRKLSTSYACAEILWYLSGEKKIKRLAAYAPQYERFADDHGEAHGAYGFRIRKQYGDLLGTVARLLKKTNHTRQAVIPIYQALDVLKAFDGDCPDIPCTISWQFILREQRLHMIVNMRSNDIWLGFPYDVFAFTTIQKMLAGSLGCEAGSYHHKVGSMHLYERNYEAAKEANAEKHYSHERAQVGSYKIVPGDTARVLEAEEQMRIHNEFHIPTNLPTIMQDMLVCCSKKHGHASLVEIHSPILSSGQKL